MSVLKFIKFKLSHPSPPVEVPTSSLSQTQQYVKNFWIKNSVMSTIQDSLTCQQFSMITNSLLQGLRIACCFTVFPSVRIGVFNCPLFPFNGCLSEIGCCAVLCGFENFAVTIDAIKRILRIS